MIVGDLTFQTLMAFQLVLVRTAALIGTLPFFSSPNVPGLVKAGLSMCLALAVTPAVHIDPAVYPTTLAGFLLVCLGEMMMGLILSLYVRLILTSVQIMGQMAGFQMGFAVANVVDPLGGGQVSVLGQFSYLMALLIFLSVGGHLWFIRALVDSFTLVPPGGFALSQNLYKQIMAQASLMFTLSIQIGAPVLAAALFTKVAMGVLAKTVPQMNIMVVGFPVTIAVGLVFMSLTLAVMGPMLVEIFSNLGPRLTGLLKVM